MNDYEAPVSPPSAPAQPELDTTTKADGPITRFIYADWDRYARWLARRVSDRWPHIAENDVPRRLNGMLQDNMMAMFKADEAVGLFRYVTDTFDPPCVRTVFLFTNGKQAYTDACRMMREAERWGERMGAKRFYADMDSDYTPGKQKDGMKFEEVRVMYHDLPRERRA